MLIKKKLKKCNFCHAHDVVESSFKSTLNNYDKNNNSNSAIAVNYVTGTTDFITESFSH